MIKLIINRQELSIVTSKVVAGTHQYLTVEADFKGSDWTDLRKWVHFSMGGQSYIIPMQNDKIEATAQLDLTEGTWEVYVHGNLIEDDAVTERITTDVKLLFVEAPHDGHPFPPLTPDFEELLANQVAEANEIARDVQSQAESGDLDGATFIPEVSEEGIISWTNNKCLENPVPRNIKGKKGDTGDSGVWIGHEAPTDPVKNVWIDPLGSAGKVIDKVIVTGTHAPGTTDNYHFYFSDGTDLEINIVNPVNGDGTGDMVRSIYDTHNHATDIFDYVDNVSSSDIFIATYNVTTFQEIEEAYNAGKMIFMRQSNPYYTMLRFFEPSDPERTAISGIYYGYVSFLSMPETGSSVTVFTCHETGDESASWSVTTSGVINKYSFDKIVFAKAVLSNGIADYDSTSTYATGDYCVRYGDYYRCITAIATPEAWNSSHWEKVTVIGEINKRIPEPANEGTTGQVLATDGNGGRYWTEGADIFYAVNGPYAANGPTTYAEITAALQAGKNVMLKLASGVCIPMTEKSSSTYGFWGMAYNLLMGFQLDSSDNWTSASYGLISTTNTVKNINQVSSHPDYPLASSVSVSALGEKQNALMVRKLTEANVTFPAGSTATVTFDVAMTGYRVYGVVAYTLGNYNLSAYNISMLGVSDDPTDVRLLVMNHGTASVTSTVTVTVLYAKT